MSPADGSPRAGNWFDGIAIGISMACMVHCLILPLIVALMPAWSRWLDVPESFHLLVLLSAVPLSTMVLWRASCRLTRGRLPFALGMAGLGLMGAGVAIEGWSIEPAVTTVGALSLAAAHLINWRRRAHCHD